MRNIKSTALLLLTAIIWGFAFVAQRMGAEYVGAFTFNGIRFGLGALSLIPVIAAFEKRESTASQHRERLKKTAAVGTAAGVILFVASALQQYGIELTGSAGKAGFITGLYTVLVPVFGIFLGKRTGINVWIGAVLAVVGIFLLSVNEKLRIGFGDAVLLIGAVFWAFHILIIDSFVDRVYALRFAFVQFSFCSLAGIVCAFIFEDVSAAAIGQALVPILYGGIGSVGVAYTCQILGQKDADPTYSAIILSTESVFGAIGGAIILHEVMSLRGYAGCALIFTGIVLSQLKSKNKNR